MPAHKSMSLYPALEWSTLLALVGAPDGEVWDKDAEVLLRAGAALAELSPQAAFPLKRVLYASAPSHLPPPSQRDRDDLPEGVVYAE